MAKREAMKDKGNSFMFVHKLIAGVALMMFLVITINGLKLEASIGSIVYRATIALVCVGMISRVVIKVLKTYEEMNSD